MRPPCFGKPAPVAECHRCGVRADCHQAQTGKYFVLAVPQAPVRKRVFNRVAITVRGK